ncbi:DNA-J related domain-containing protein [Phytopseudomonas seleniipraecipitans]|uniref:DNA-J related protein n=1 Tax=Phytopseudomonas seleniipraecipitans TaxID=640205 RepID=A0A1G7I1G4_9GAMM|nr:DNA-J related domain-containing protein [Pseudomonas seleniipraecipitans]SDF06627.1 DNA-J related protein [Pseudomonas seleniipraecipitans]
MNEEIAPTPQLLELLEAAPEGLSEYELLLRLSRWQGADERLPTDPLELFRTHFLLFHTLYTLRDQLHGQGSALLQISPLCIRLLPYQEGERALSENDPLRDYYLDLTQLRDTGAEDVHKLLGNFWMRLQGGEEKQLALAALELDPQGGELDLATIRQRYRQLVSVHHPDRGGSTQHLQRINHAMETLQRYYR